MDAAAVRKALERMLANGPLTALPRTPADLDLLLALGAARFDAQCTYSEFEVNALLEAWLGTFCAPFGVDHVTFRRCLVDAGLLVRDRAGTTYGVSTQRIASLLDEGARDLDPAVSMRQARQAREERKSARKKGAG